MLKCFCGLIHSNYKSDEQALLSDAYHDLFQGVKPQKEWMEAVFEILTTAQEFKDVLRCPDCGDVYTWKSRDGKNSLVCPNCKGIKGSFYERI